MFVIKYKFIILNRIKGYSMAMTLVSLAILSSLLLMLYSLSVYYLNSSKLEIMRTQAYSLAEGGIDKALHELSYDPSYSGETNLTITGNVGVADITVTSVDSSTRIITSQSYIPNKTNTQFARKFRVVANRDPSVSGNAFTFAIQAGEGGFWSAIGKNPHINGSIYSNQNVEILGPGSAVDGNVDAVGTVKVPKKSVAGSITQGVSVAPMPTVDFEYWKEQAQNIGTTHDGDYSIAGNGDYYFGGAGNISIITGRLLISGNANIYLKGPVWIKGTNGSSIEISSNPKIYISADLEGNKTIILCDGKITFSGNARIESQKADTWLLLISTYPGSLDVNNTSIAIDANVHLEDTILYGYNSAINFGTNSSGVFAGAFVAQKILIYSNLSLSYQTGLGSISLEQAQAPEGGGFTVSNSSFAELKP